MSNYLKTDKNQQSMLFFLLTAYEILSEDNTRIYLKDIGESSLLNQSYTSILIPINF